MHLYKQVLICNRSIIFLIDISEPQAFNLARLTPVCEIILDRLRLDR